MVFEPQRCVVDSTGKAISQLNCLGFLVGTVVAVLLIVVSVTSRFLAVVVFAMGATGTMGATGCGVAAPVMILCVGLSSVGCGSVSPQVDVVVDPDTGARERGDTQGQALDERDLLESVLCTERQPCSVAHLHDAGMDAEGRHLFVADVLLSAVDHPRARDRAAALGGDCARVSWEAVIVRGGEIESTWPLVQACNDGYGARGMGEDVVEVGPNVFVHDRVGGSSWIWSEHVELQLSPFRVVGQGSHGEWLNGSNLSDLRYQPQDFDFRGMWFSPDCGEVPLHPLEDGHGEFSWQSVPWVSVDEEWTFAQWRSIPLGECGAPMDGLPVRALVTSQRDLFVEFAPNVRGALGVHMAGERPSYQQHCVQPGDFSPVQRWAFSAPLGNVLEVKGQAYQETPKVVVGDMVDGERVRWKLALPLGVGTLSLAWTGQDGVMSGTSTFGEGGASPDVRGLGDLKEMPYTPGCVVEGGRLVAQPIVLPRSTEPLVRGWWD